MNKSDCQKPKRFGFRPITDAQDRADDCDCKLKCVGTLIAVADLECFGDGHPEGERYRYGLSRIIQDIANEYEKNIDQLRADYERCPEAIMNTASKLQTAIANGRFENNDQAMEQIDGMVKKLDGVIDTFGDEYPATEHRAGLLGLKTQISELLLGTGQKMRQTG